jgi:uncharacterized protein involved in exopolysaccharide biosynthesis
MSENQKINASGELTLRELISKTKEWYRYLLSKWMILLLAGILGAAIGFTYAYFQKPNYVATLTFALEDEKSGGGLGGALGLASSLGIDLGTNAGGAFTGANLIELMKSRRLIEQSLLDTVKLDGKLETIAELYIRFNGLREQWAKKETKQNEALYFPVHADRKQFTLQQDSLLGVICMQVTKMNLSVMQKDKKISIINIDVKSASELFSKCFTEALVSEVSDFYINTKSKKAKSNVEILQKQADSIREELNSAITGVASANDNTYNLNPALNIRRTPSIKRQVDVQANTAILTQLVINLELAKVTLRKETPLIQVIDTPILPLEKVKTSKLISLIMGGFLAGIFMVIWLILKKLI